MVDLILWKRLTKSDHNAMHGKAAPSGSGGGARHIALGVQTKSFPIAQFLKSAGPSVAIHTEESAGQYPQGELRFRSNPGRRGGEWLIGDQFTHRHPAWSVGSGFPTVYDRKDRPYIFVARIAGRFHARFIMQGNLAYLSSDVRKLLHREKGIERIPPDISTLLALPPATLLELFEEAAGDQTQDDEFDPADIEDGRNRILASVLQRLGQQAFRKAILAAYEQKCAITDCNTQWVLEAAHIVPYKGKQTNATSNGLLLRGDVHILFDIGLISVDPDSVTVVVSSLLGGSEYENLAGKPLSIPKKQSHRPSKAALSDHFSRFRA